MLTPTETHFTGSHDSSLVTEGKRFIAALSILTILYQSILTVPLAYAQTGTVFESSAAASSSSAETETYGSGATISQSSSSISEITSSSVSSAESSTESSESSSEASSSSTSESSSSVSSESAQSSSIAVTLTGNTILDVPENTHPTFEIEKTAEIQSSEELEERITVIITDPTGETSEALVAVTDNLGEYLLTLEPPPNFMPGKYHVEARLNEARGVGRRVQRFFRMAFTGDSGDTILFEQDFTWGVVAFNPDRSVYLPGESGAFSLAVLDDKGKTICDSNVTMKVTKPDGKIQTFTTKDKSIYINPDCKDKEVTYVPDYSFNFEFDDIGIYEFEMSATTKNGIRRLSQDIETTEDRLIDVKRFSATRIYPLANYDMKLKVTPSKTFIGNISEVVPTALTIVSVEPTPKDIETNEDTGEQTITWGEKLWEAGVTYEFEYTYDAPDVSPEFYLAGPLSADGTLTEPLKESVNVTDISSSSEESSESSVASSEDSSQASSIESSMSSESSEASSSEDSFDSSESSVGSEEFSSSSESSSSDQSNESASSVDSSDASESSETSSMSSVESASSEASESSEAESESSSSTSWIQKALTVLFPYIHAQSLIEDTLAFEEPRQWQIASDATGLTITGRFLTNDGVNTISGYNVAVSLNGGAVAASDTTDAGGEYVITNLTMTAGTIVSLFGNGTAEKAVTVTLGSGSNMTGIDLIQNRLTVRSDSGTTALTVQHLDIADNSGDAEFARIYTIDSGVLNVKVGKGLTIWQGDTFRPGAEIRVGSGMTINGRFEWGTNPVLLSGSWLTGSQGSFTGTNIVSFNGRFFNGLTTRRYIATNGYAFSGVTFSQPTGGVYTFTGTTIHIMGDLLFTVGNGFTGIDNSLSHANVYIDGSIRWNATTARLNPGNGTWYVGKHLLLPNTPSMTLGTSKWVTTGSGVLVRVTTVTRPLKHISFSGSATLWNPGGNQIGIGGEFIIGAGATVTLSGSTNFRPFSGTPNYSFYENSRLYGASPGNVMQVSGSGSIRVQNGTIDIGRIWIYGQHNATGSGYIAPARYDSPFLFTPELENHAKLAFPSGTFRFMEDVMFGSNSPRFVIDNRATSPRLVFEKDLVVYSSGASTNLAWYKGDGSLVFSGSNIQNVYFGASRIYEDIEINKDTGKAVRFTGTGSTGLITDGINLRRGELELLGRPLAVSGSITISGGSFKAGSGAVRLSGSLLNTGGWFAASTGSMVLDGGNQTLSGSNTFNTLTKIVSVARTLTLAGTKTQTVSGALILQGAAGALLSLRSTIDGVRAKLKLVSGGSQTLDHLDVKDNDASDGLRLTCTYSEGCLHSGNNLNWELPFNVTGKVFTDEGVTSIGAAKIVSMSLNGGTAIDSTPTDGGGQFTLSGSFMTGGTIITLYLDGNTEKGVTVTLGSGSAMTGVNIYQNRLIVRSDSGSVAMTNATLIVADNNADTDISAIYTVDSNVLNVKSGKALTVWASDTFTPGAEVRVGSGITINGSFLMGANAVALSGAWLARDAGSFTGTNIVTFNGVWATTGHKRLIGSNGSSFSGITIDTTGGTWALSGALSLVGNFSTTTRASSSTVFDNTVRNAGPNTVRGTFTWAGLGTFRPGGHTWTFQNNISFASNMSSLVSTNNPQLVMAGTGRVLTCPVSSKPLIHFSFSGSTRLAATNGQCTIGRKFTVGSGATITLTDGETLATNTTAANIQLLGSNSRITGGTATLLSIASTGSIRIQRGVIATDIMYVSGVHNPVPAGTGMIAAGRYLSNRIEFAPGTSIAFATGTTIFGGDVFFNQGASTYFYVRNNVYNPTLVFKKNLSLSQVAGAAITWEKGSGSLVFSGSTAQNIYLNGKNVEDIVIDKTAAVRLTGTGTTAGTTDSITIRNGSFEQLEKTLAVSGSITLQSGTTYKQGSGALSLSGNLLNTGGWFGASTGTTTLNGTNQTLSGSNSFYNLTKIVSVARTLTLAGTKTQTISGALTLQGASAAARLSLRSTTTGVQAKLNLISAGTQAISALDVRDNNATGQELVCLEASENCADSGNNTNWLITIPVITGKVFSDEGVTGIGAGKIISASLNGGTVFDSTPTDANGMYSLSGATMTGGSILTLFFNGNSEKGVTVTLGSGSSMTGVNIYQDRLIARSDSGSVAITNTFLRLAQNSNSSDADISAIYTVDTDVLNVKIGKALTIWTGDIFTPGAAVNIGSGITINGTFTMEANAVALSGSWITNSSGTFTAAANTVTFDGNDTTTRNINVRTSSFANIAFRGGSSALYQLQNNLTASGTMVLNTGTYTLDVNDFDLDVTSNVTFGTSTTEYLGNGTITIGGSLSCAASTVYSESSTVIMEGTSKSFTCAQTNVFNNVTLSGSTNATFSSLTVRGKLILQPGITFTQGSTTSTTLSGSTADMEIRNGAIFNGADTVAVNVLSGAGISVMSGTLRTGTLSIEGSHIGNGNRIAAALYSVSREIRFRNSTGSSVTQEFSAGTTTLSGAVVFDGHATSSPFEIDNSVTDPSLVFVRNVTFREGGGAVQWTKGDGAIIFSGATTQSVNLLGKTVEDITIDKSEASVQLTGTGTTDGITLAAGTFEHLNKALTVSGSVTVNAGSYKLGSGTLTLAGNLINKSMFTTTTGSVILNGANQTLSGSTSFYNLTKIVTAARTLTLAGTKTQTVSGALTLQGVSATDRLSLRSTTTGVQANLKLITGGTQTINALDVKDNNATGQQLVCLDPGEGCNDSGNNTNWVISTPTVTGKVFTDEGVTSIGAGKVVSYSVNGGAISDSDGTDAGGFFTLSGATMTGGSIITLYLDGNTEKGVTVTLGSGSSMTGINLYQNRLIVRSDSGSVAMTNAKLIVADNNADTDISAIYTVDSNVLNVKSGKALIVWTGDTFTPGAAVNVGSGITINGTFTMGANAVALSGSWTTAGQFTGTNFVTFNGTDATTRTITSNGYAFSGLTIIGANSATYSLSDQLSVSGAFTLNAGTYTFDANDKNVHIDGAVSLGNSTVNLGDGTWKVKGDFTIESTQTTLNRDSSTIVMLGSNKQFGIGGPTKTFNNVTFSGSSTIAGSITYFAGKMILQPSITLSRTAIGNVVFSGSTADLEVRQNAIIDFPSGNLLHFLSGSSISVHSGSISVGIFTVDGSHSGNGNRLAAGVYGGRNTILFRNNLTSNATAEFSPGTTTLSGAVTFQTVSTSAPYTISNATTNANIVFSKTVAFSKSTGNVIWNKGTGTITFSGSTASQTFQTNGQPFEDIIVNKPSGSVLLTGTGTTDSLTMTQGTFNQRGYAWDIDGGLTLNGGTYQSLGGNLLLSGSLVNNGGGFAAGTGTVTLNGTNQTLSGSTSFYNLTKIVTAARTLTLAGTKTQTVTGALVLTGASGQRLSLRSTTTGVQANLKLVSGGSQTLTYLDVKDNNATGVQLNCETNCESSGNTTNWKFGSAGTGSIVGTIWVDTDGDGTRDGGENSGLSGVTLTLTGNSATGQTVSLSRTSNSLGNYGFSGVVLNNSAGYTVAIDLSSVTGYIRTGITSSGGILLSTGSTIRQDFGFVQVSTLTGSVFVDLDEDGAKDSGEITVFSGASLTLTGTTGTGGSLSRTVLSNASGTYTFSNLPTGSGNFLLVITPPSGYETTATDSRSVTIATGGQTKNEHFGYIPETVSSSSSSSSEESGTSGTSGGLREETIELQIREATEEDKDIEEEPTPVTRPLTPEEEEAKLARELVRNERERRDERMRKLARLLRIDQEENTYLSRVEERKRERLRELALIEQLKPKPLISLKPIPHSPATDLLDAVKDSYLKKVTESAKRVTAFIGEKLFERAKDMQHTVAETRERFARVISLAQDNVFSLAVLLKNNFTEGTSSLIAVIGEFRNTQRERLTRIVNRTLDDVSMLAVLLTDDLIDGTASLIAQIGVLRNDQREQQRYARTVARSTLIGSVKPIGDGATTLALTIGAALTNGMMNTGEVGKTFALALIMVKDSVDSLGNLVAFRTTQLTNFTEREIGSALAWTEKSTDRIFALTMDIANDRIIGNIRSTLALRDEIAGRREETSQILLTFTRESLATFRQGGQVALEQSGEWTGETGEKLVTLTRDAAKETIVDNIRSTLELRDEIANHREEAARIALNLVRDGVTTFKRGAEIASEQSSKRLSRLGTVSEGARQSAVLALAKMLGVSDRIKRIDDNHVPIADIPMEYKTKIRTENGKTVLAAFHMNITNAFGDPYRNTPVVLFSTPKVAVTNEQGIVTFHSVEVGMHHVEIHSGDNVERREVIIEPPADLLAFDSKPTDVVLPVVQIVVSQPQHGAAPDKTTVPPLALALIALLVLGNIYTFYPVIRMYRRRRLGK